MRTPVLRMIDRSTARAMFLAVTAGVVVGQGMWGWALATGWEKLERISVVSLLKGPIPALAALYFASSFLRRAGIDSRDTMAGILFTVLAGTVWERDVPDAIALSLGLWGGGVVLVLRNNWTNYRAQMTREADKGKDPTQVSDPSQGPDRS